MTLAISSAQYPIERTQLQSNNRNSAQTKADNAVVDKKEDYSGQIATVRNNPDVVAKLDNESSNFTRYDSPGFTANHAISAYNAQANAEKRAEVQSLLGVDVYV